MSLSGLLGGVGTARLPGARTSFWVGPNAENGTLAGGGGGGGGDFTGAVCTRRTSTRPALPAAVGAAGGEFIWAPGVELCRFSMASNTSEQCPQRTHPSAIFSWSGTTLNIVPHTGQRVVKLMRGLLQPSINFYRQSLALRANIRGRIVSNQACLRAVINIQPSSSSLTAREIQGA